MQPLQYHQEPSRNYRAGTSSTGHFRESSATPAIFPDQSAPIVRNAPDGARELTMARWGMPGPPQFGGAPITNIRNTNSPHWRPWLRREQVRGAVGIVLRGHQAEEDANVVCF